MVTLEAFLLFLSLCFRRVKRLDLKSASGPQQELNGLPVVGYNSANCSYDNDYLRLLLLFFLTQTSVFSLIFRMVWLVSSPAKTAIKLDPF